MNRNLEKFRIEKPIDEFDDLSVYGFEKRWDLKSIEKAVKKATLKKEMPNFILSRIELHPSATCNLNCHFCSGSNLKSNNKKDLPFSAIKDLFQDIRKNMPYENPIIFISGIYSEPLLHKNIKEIIKEVGNSGFRFGIYTNGLLMDEELEDIIIEAAGKVFKDKPSHVSFNVSASLINESFDVLLEKIKRLISENNKKIIEINVPIVISSDLEIEIYEEAVNRLLKIGVDNIRLSVAHPKFNKNKKEKINLKAVNMLKKLEEEYKNKIRVRHAEKCRKFNKCFTIAHTATVSQEGNVYPCAETASPVFKEFSYGNILKQKFSKIWRSNRHLKFFDSLNPKKARCICCPVDEKFNALCSEFWNNQKNSIKNLHNL